MEFQKSISQNSANSSFQVMQQISLFAKSSESGVAQKDTDEPMQSFACFLVNRQDNLMDYVLTIDSQQICIVSQDNNHVKAALSLDFCHPKKAPSYQVH